MNTAGHIAYLHRREIDTVKWERCIENSLSPLIYGRSDYLDGITNGQWDALVLDDYHAVMPLTWRSKYGIRYLYQPAFTQQTGIFFHRSASPPDPPSASPSAPVPARPPAVQSTVDAFLTHVDRHFRFAEIYLNYTNAHPALSPHTNFILDLGTTYEQLSGRYKKDLIRNLKLAQRGHLIYTKDVDLHTALHDFRQEYAKRLPAIKEEDYRRFERLCIHLRQDDQVLTRAVIDDRQQRLCSAVFLRDTHRFYLLHSTTLPAGREMEANHFLLDQFIREWAGVPMLLDFEGSDHPGIAHFYSNFGGIDQPYFFYRRNRLPWPVRWLK